MIHVKQLEKKFRKKNVLTNLSFAVEEPKIIALIGRNGVGKSTLLKLLAGHLKPTKGQLEVVGEKPFNSLKVASNTILIQEEIAFPQYFTLVDILQQGKQFYPNWQQELAEKLLAYADIPLKSHHSKLSTGQRAVFNLVYGLATRCAVTLLDEPMNGMDEAIRSDFYRAILKEYIAYPRCIIISSHYLAEINHLVEDILLIDKGAITLYAPIHEVQEMAVKLRGNKAVIDSMEIDEAILYRYTEDQFCEVVVFPERLEQVTGVEVLPVSASEVCKYMTDRKGGIDDVFK